MKTRRPSKYKPEYCDLAETLLGQDRPMCAVAAALSVHRGTLRDWKKKYSQFSTTVNRGRTKGKAVFMEKVEGSDAVLVVPEPLSNSSRWQKVGNNHLITVDRDRSISVQSM